MAIKTKQAQFERQSMKVIPFALCTALLTNASFTSIADDKDKNKVEAEAVKKKQAEQIEVLSIVSQRPGLNTTTGSVEVVGEAQLARFEFDDVHRLLQSVPGVYIREEDGFGLRPNIGLRGATTERSAKVALMEDGVLLAPAPYAAPAAYFFPLMSRMTQVEVFKGPSAIAYGPNTVGGAINFVSRPIAQQYAKGQSGGLDLSLGDLGYQKLHGHYSKGWGQTALSLEGMSLKSDGFKSLGNRATGGDQDTGFDKQEALLKLSFVPENSRYEQAWLLKLGYAQESSNETYLGLTDEDFNQSPQQRYAASQLDVMDWQHYQAQLTHKIEMNDDLSLQTSLYHRRFERDWDRLNSFYGSRPISTVLAFPERGINALYLDVLKGERDSQTDDEQLLYTLNGRRYLSEGLETRVRYEENFWYMDINLDAGLRLHRDWVERDHRAQVMAMMAGQLTPTEAELIQTARNKDQVMATSGFMNMELGYGYWTANAGMRLEFIEGESSDVITGSRRTNRDQILLPGAGLFYKLNRHSGLLFGVNKGFVPNSPGQADNIRPEESWNYEMGYRYQQALGQYEGQGGVKGELIGFFNDYRNLKGKCTQSSGCDQALDLEFNGGRVHVYGLEGSLAKIWAWSPSQSLRLPTRLAYTYTASEFQTDFTSDFNQWGQVQTGDALPYLPKHQMSLEVGLETSDWGASALVKYVSAMQEVAGKGELSGLETDAQWQLDLAFFYQVGRAFRFYGKLDNATDASHLVSRRPYGARGNKPRQLSVGLKYQF